MGKTIKINNNEIENTNVKYNKLNCCSGEPLKWGISEVVSN